MGGTQRIDKLTKAQEARFAEWVEKWIKIGHCTNEADWEDSRAAINECYRLSDLEPPRNYVCVQSPLVLAIAAPIAARILDRRVAVDVAVRGAVRVAVDVAVDVAVRGAVDDAVDDAVRGAVDVAVGDAVRDAVDVAVGGAVDVAVRGKYIRDKWWRLLGGQMWVSWQAYESFFDDCCALTHCKLDHARAYRRAQSASFWWWPHRHFVMVCNRPEIMRVENDNGRWRLSCHDGPSVRFRDGWSLWHVDGVTVNEQIVMRPSTLTVEQIHAEPNEEVRRIAIERFGWLRYLEESHSTVIDAGRNDIENTYEILAETPIGQRLITHCPSTGRRYSLGIPDQKVKTRAAAQQRLWGDRKGLRICGRT